MLPNHRREQWPGLVLSSSSTRILMDQVLLPLYCALDASRVCGIILCNNEQIYNLHVVLCMTVYNMAQVIVLYTSI